MILAMLKKPAVFFPLLDYYSVMNEWM